MKYVGMTPKNGTPLSLGTPGRIWSEDTELNVRNPKSMSSPTAAVTATDGFMPPTISLRASGIMVAVLINVSTVAKFGKAQFTDMSKMIL